MEIKKMTGALNALNRVVAGIYNKASIQARGFNRGIKKGKFMID